MLTPFPLSRGLSTQSYVFSHSMYLPVVTPLKSLASNVFYKLMTPKFIAIFETLADISQYFLFPIGLPLNKNKNKTQNAK